MLKIKLLLLALLLMPLLLVAQVDYVSDFNRLTDYETGDAAKQELSKKLTQALVADMQKSDFVVDSLGVRQIKFISSPEGLLRICTWHYSLRDATAQYGGIIEYGENIFPLQFNDLPIVAGEVYTQDNWCGGIYYDIIPIKRKGKSLYTLLAWDGNNGVTSKKIIDVLSFDRKGKPIFGLRVFVKGRMSTHRVIIEYPASNTLLLELDAEQKGIVSNALFANDDKFTDVSEYFSVSDDFNVYRYEDEKWVLYINVDLRLNKKDSKALQNNTVSPSSGL